jgi:hypothetical protein
MALEMDVATSKSFCPVPNKQQVQRSFEPPKGPPGQHAYTFIIRILSRSLTSVSLSVVTLGIYLSDPTRWRPTGKHMNCTLYVFVH